MSKTKKLTQVAMLIAMEIILTRFLSIQTPIVRIGFGFLPIAVIAMLHGPLYAGIGAALADFIGVMLFPAGSFFPGFTLSALLMGVAYGVFLYNRPKSFARILLAVLVVTVPIQLGLTTLWVQILTGEAYLALLPVRLIRTLIMTPIQVICIRLAASERFYLRLIGRPAYERPGE